MQALNPWREGPPPADVAAYWVGAVTDSWAVYPKDAVPDDVRAAGQRYKPDGRVWWRPLAEIPGTDYAMRNFNSWNPHVVLYALGSTESPTTVLVAAEGGT